MAALRPHMIRVVLAEPSCRERIDVDHRDARILGGELIEDGACVVGGAIVDGDDAQGWILEGQHGAERLPHRAPLVLGRDDDGHRKILLGEGSCVFGESYCVVE